jgi:hypothetical protein
VEDHAVHGPCVVVIAFLFVKGFGTAVPGKEDDR